MRPPFPASRRVFRALLVTRLVARTHASSLVDAAHRLEARDGTPEATAGPAPCARRSESGFEKRKTKTFLFSRCLTHQSAMAPADAADAARSNRWDELNAKRREQSMYTFIFPLLYAPALPLIRIALRNRPHLRNRAYGVGIAVGLAHAGYVMGRDSSV